MKKTSSLATWLTAIVALAIVLLGLVYVVNKDRTKELKKELTSLTPITAADHTQGSSTSKIVLVEYSDFQCPACAAYAPMVTQLIGEYKDKILFVYRYYPLLQHKNAKVSAYAAEAAGKQGKFFEMSEILFAKQTEWENVSYPENIFTQYAQTLGLNIDQFKNDSTSLETKQRVDKDYIEGTKIPILGTPTFFLNGVSISNPRNYQEFKQIIDNAIKNS